eukprot:jgi/Chlat1/6287/Chrsp44S05875
MATARNLRQLREQFGHTFGLDMGALEERLQIIQKLEALIVPVEISVSIFAQQLRLLYVIVDESVEPVVCDAVPLIGAVVAVGRVDVGFVAVERSAETKLPVAVEQCFVVVLQLVGCAIKQLPELWQPSSIAVGLCQHKLLSIETAPLLLGEAASRFMLSSSFFLPTFCLFWNSWSEASSSLSSVLIEMGREARERTMGRGTKRKTVKRAIRSSATRRRRVQSLDVLHSHNVLRGTIGYVVLRIYKGRADHSCVGELGDVENGVIE